MPDGRRCLGERVEYPGPTCELRDIRSTVGMVFQTPDNQIVATIVEEDVAFGPENLGVPHDEIVERVDWSLEQVDMTPYRHRAPHMLSGGQKQRVCIAGMLAMRPDVLVLDEATAMLDPLGRKEVLAIARRLNKERAQPSSPSPILWGRPSMPIG